MGKVDTLKTHLACFFLQLPVRFNEDSLDRLPPSDAFPIVPFASVPASNSAIFVLFIFFGELDVSGQTG
jgi:hypothetical protein